MNKLTNKISWMNPSLPLTQSRALAAVGGFILAAAAITAILHGFYYAIYPWVLSQNIIFPTGVLTPWIEKLTLERDGIEIYVLYLLMFVSMLSLFSWIWVWPRFSPVLKTDWVRKVFFIGAGALALILFLECQFTPPSEIISPLKSRVLHVMALGAVLATLLFFQKKVSTKVGTIFALLIAIPFCFIETNRMDTDNYAYLFDSAQRLMDGNPISKIYFQYEFFLSLLVAFFMKFHINYFIFQIVGQLSNYVAFLGIFFMARKLFRQESLAMLLLVAFIFIRILCAPWDPVCVFQITPLRLDLWLIPFFLVYRNGPKHWSLPFVFGLLMFFHGPLGLMYTLGYVQLILTFGVLSVFDVGLKASIERWKLLITPKTILAAVYLIACFIAARVVFAENIATTAWYQKIGIGFLPMQDSSFFWFYPIVFSSAFTLLFWLKNSVSPRYLALGYLLIYFVAGNCVYFFGRTHEMNLFSVAIPLLFLLFYTFDLYDRWLAQASGGEKTKLKYNPVIAVSILFLLGAAYKCTWRIDDNLSLQKENLLSWHPHPQDPFRSDKDRNLIVAKEVRSIIGDQAKIQFLIAKEADEFALYEIFRKQGNPNEAYMYPFQAWIFWDDLVKHAQGLIDKGTYILIDQRHAPVIFEPKMSHIGFKQDLKSGTFRLIGRDQPVVSAVH